mmetsp:Transcript_90704/g.163725  ORF Transcript_90704/g.163725 Transcript_90704/m.163725 type:complete len:210 (-) Transcript_90704:325-954(-)
MNTRTTVSAGRRPQLKLLPGPRPCQWRVPCHLSSRRRFGSASRRTRRRPWISSASAKRRQRQLLALLLLPQALMTTRMSSEMGLELRQLPLSLMKKRMSSTLVAALTTMMTSPHRHDAFCQRRRRLFQHRQQLQRWLWTLRRPSVWQRTGRVPWRSRGSVRRRRPQRLLLMQRPQRLQQLAPRSLRRKILRRLRWTSRKRRTFSALGVA